MALDYITQLLQGGAPPQVGQMGMTGDSPFVVPPVQPLKSAPPPMPRINPRRMVPAVDPNAADQPPTPDPSAPPAAAAPASNPVAPPVGGGSRIRDLLTAAAMGAANVPQSAGKAGAFVSGFAGARGFEMSQAEKAAVKTKEAEERTYQRTQDAAKLKIEQQRADALTGKTTGANGTGGSIPDDISQAIINGDQPPTTTGLYKYGAPVRAKLAQAGYNLTKATEDWTATQKRLATANSATQLRINQAISIVEESLPKVEDLAQQWQGGRFPALNKATLAAAEQGLLEDAYPGSQKIAALLGAQIADITSELGTVYKGGNSSTDHSLELAGENLKKDWSVSTMLAGIAQIRDNLRYRKNSMKQLTAGTPGNPYDQPETPEAGPGGTPPPAAPQSGAPAPSPTGATPAAAATAPPVAGAKQAPDGNWYVDDPSRPGKYFQVQP